ncbi:hypothetical protein M407DRAFT_81064 [Tulasnella calospora MUT 4182]|uniref:Protein kinase domain-containing protein n=1 Tax=Tulasnella calospora MUT 4182 TaxID=1051891 RepID=A0A0C3Q8X2_9AGAM|nr:hypothetical protein M407DRAFT_81064 [Tulasnella calospora MUT 4182]
MLREAKAWKALRHTYILPLLGFKVYGTNPCLISPWCPEGDLELYLGKYLDWEFGDRFKMANIYLFAVVQVGLGLNFIHTKPIVHGDIKPKNVLIYQGKPAICDFGTARWIEESADTTSGIIAARTVRYASPERLAESRAKTTKSDVWSFGGLALFVLSGKHPYFRYDGAKTREQILDGRFPEPTDYSTVPLEQPIWAILKACWKLDPSERRTMVDVIQSVRPRQDIAYTVLN